MIDPVLPVSMSEVPVEGWIEAIGVPTSVASSVVRGLGAFDVRLRPRDSSDPKPNGVVVFSTATQNVVDFIAEVTSRRPERIVAVSTSPSLPNPDGWSL